MKSKNTSSKIILQPDHFLFYSLDALKIGHSVLSGFMSKFPVTAAIAITNDAVFNLSVSTIAQGKNFDKSVVEVVGGITAGFVCTVSGGYLSGTIAATLCGVAGGEFAGKVYDIIAESNGHGNTEDFTKEYPLNNTGSTIEELLEKYNTLDNLEEGGYAYVNSISSGSELFTKKDGKLQKVPTSDRVLLDQDFLDKVNVTEGILSINTGEMRVKIEMLKSHQGKAPDLDIEVINHFDKLIERNILSCLDLDECSKTYDIPLDRISSADNSSLVTSDISQSSVNRNAYLIKAKLDDCDHSPLLANRLYNQHIAQMLESSIDMEQSAKKTLHASIESSNNSIEDNAYSIANLVEQAQAKMVEQVNAYVAEQERPEKKLARYGFTKTDIESSPMKVKHIMDNYEFFSTVYHNIQDRSSIKLTWDDIPEEIDRFKTIIGNSDTICDFFQCGFIKNLNELPCDQKLLDKIFEYSMGIEFMQENFVI